MSGKSLLMDKPKKTVFSYNEICKIISVCKKSGLKSFEFGDLKLEFSDKDHVQENIPKPVKTKLEVEDKNKEAKILEDSKQEKLDELLLLDPYAYEQLLEVEDGE